MNLFSDLPKLILVCATADYVSGQTFHKRKNRGLQVLYLQSRPQYLILFNYLFYVWHEEAGYVIWYISIHA